MKKLAALIACIATMAAATAHAEHKLLITDVLDAKQFEAQAGYEYTHAWGKAHVNTSESLFSIGAGLGHGLEVTAAIPYVFSENVSIPGEEPEHRDGVGDFSFGAKYRLLNEKPVTMVVGFDVKFDTAGGGNAGTRTTDFTPYVAVSKDLGHELKPYAAYLATLRNNDAQDSHTFRVGVEKELCHHATLDAKADISLVPGQGAADTYQIYSFELGAYLQMAHNFYLLPSVAVFTQDHKEGSINGVKTAAALYYLF